MSHGGGSTCEPNLTPLLDIVLQLLMFFILVTRFVSVSQDPDTDDKEQSDARIYLPKAESGSALGGTSDYIFLLVNRGGRFYFPFDRDQNERDFDQVIGQIDVDKEGKVKSTSTGWLFEQWNHRREEKGVDAAMPAIIVKADAGLPFEQFDQILAACTKLKMYDVRLRVDKQLKAAQ